MEGTELGAQSRWNQSSLTQPECCPPQLPTVMAFQMLAHLSGLSRALQLADTPGPCLPVPTFYVAPDPWSSPDHATHVTGLDLLLWVKLSHFFLSLQSIWCRF